jgi:hypothetical protein
VQASDSRDSFVVDLSGVKLSAEDKVKLAGAIQGAALSAFATFDGQGDHFAIAFPHNGGTQGIRIIERSLLERRLPDLGKTLEDLARHG